ncbi:MAG TPA: EAL domain-containing protein [Dissulfurispiraceae bacterium]|nr:EAL domain-containing protein [Dissulfurispiraceae bacterium]
MKPKPQREVPLIMLVDDDETMRFLAAELLAEAGFKAEEIADGITAVESFEKIQPDLVLLDVQMPGLDGFTVCERLRKLPSGEFVPILMMTGLGDSDSINRAYQVGATDFITKPFKYAILGHHVRYILRSSKTAQELRISQERYALAARGTNDGMWDWDIDSASVYYSPRWKSMFGYAEDEIGNSLDEWFGRIHPDDIEQVKMLVSAHLSGASDHFEAEFRVRHNDTADRWMLCRGLAVRDSNGKAYRMAGSISDITSRKRAEEQLLRDAFHDSLTGLANRALLIDRLQHAFIRSIRNSEHTFAVIFLDLDRFKVINDSMGHNIGDQLLVEVSKRLKECVRSGDTVARLGGDEFVILVEDLDEADQAKQTAERIQDVLKEPFVIGGTEMFVSCSIGIAFSSPEYLKAEDMLRDADTAMYHAKEKGKARHVIFDKSMHTQAVTILQLEGELRRALDNNEFRLHYQPIVSLRTGQVVAVEALIRWAHPQRGMIMPLDFIPFAEENGLIVPIGEWVLREACRQIKRWNDLCTTEISVAVNVSPKQLRQKDFVQTVLSILNETALNASLLEIEITESVIMEDSTDTVNVLIQLRELGVHLSIDDFGTGYSSLSYLPRFPVNSVKIDRSFVSKMLIDPHNLEIIKTVVLLSNSMGLESTAEGVETIDQLERLKELGCSQSQGYLFSRPAGLHEIERLLKSAIKVSMPLNKDIVLSDLLAGLSKSGVQH